MGQGGLAMTAPALNSDRVTCNAMLQRREQAKLRQQRRRAKMAESGVRKIEVVLSEAEWAAFERFRSIQKGPVEGFAKRALLLGARFCANSGQPKGSKV